MEISRLGSSMVIRQTLGNSPLWLVYNITIKIKEYKKHLTDLDFFKLSKSEPSVL